MTQAYISDISAPRFLKQKQDAAQTLALGATLFCAALMPATAAAYLMDDRLINGVNVWSKPLKFQLSLAVHFTTLVLLLGLLTEQARGSRLVRFSLAAAAGSAAAELVYITLQSARGRASHFNHETALETALYQVMGIGALTLVVVPAIVGVQIWRNGRADVGRGLKLGAALGLILGCVATVITAGILSSEMVHETGRWLNGARDDSRGIPVMGWSGTGGDLRVPHFFALHIMQALPLAGLAADRWAKGQEKARVCACVAVWLLIVAGTFWQAASGRAFIAIG